MNCAVDVAGALKFEIIRFRLQHVYNFHTICTYNDHVVHICTDILIMIAFIAIPNVRFTFRLFEADVGQTPAKGFVPPDAARGQTAAA